jgi:probable F420-dependent oxidoreductase
MAARPFRFSITLGDFADRKAFVDTVRRVEDSGFHILAGVDHIGPPLGVMPMLATAAAISSLRLSPLVIANDYRHPVILAKEAATIDVLSDGRFELGIGTGWIRDQYESAGMQYDRPGVRVDRLTEAIDVIKGCWSAEPFEFDGEHYSVDLVGAPAPVQPDGPPILIGAAGQRMLRLAARKADIVGITVTVGQSDFSSFAHAVATSALRIGDQLAVLRDEAGARYAELELNVLIHYMRPQPGGAAETAAELGVELATLLASPHYLAGSPQEMADRLVEHRERHGISYVSFRGADIDLAVPVVERLSGT